MDEVRGECNGKTATMTLIPSQFASFPSPTEAGAGPSDALARSRPADLAVLCFSSSIGSTGASPLLTVTHPM